MCCCVLGRKRLCLPPGKTESLKAGLNEVSSLEFFNILSVDAVCLDSAVSLYDLTDVFDLIFLLLHIVIYYFLPCFSLSLQ